jgi:hypothetical protein
MQQRARDVPSGAARWWGSGGRLRAVTGEAAPHGGWEPKRRAPHPLVDLLKRHARHNRPRPRLCPLHCRPPDRLTPACLGPRRAPHQRTASTFHPSRTAPGAPCQGPPRCACLTARPRVACLCPPVPCRCCVRVCCWRRRPLPPLPPAWLRATTRSSSRRRAPSRASCLTASACSRACRTRRRRWGRCGGCPRRRARRGRPPCGTRRLKPRDVSWPAGRRW